MKSIVSACAGLIAIADAARWRVPLAGARVSALCQGHETQSECAAAIARSIVQSSKECFAQNPQDEAAYGACTRDFCSHQCGHGYAECQTTCASHAEPLFAKFSSHTAQEEPASNSSSVERLKEEAREAAKEQAQALSELTAAHHRLQRLGGRLAARGRADLRSGHQAEGTAVLAQAQRMSELQEQIETHLANVEHFRSLGRSQAIHAEPVSPSFLQRTSSSGGSHAQPEDQLAQEMTHDLEMNFNKIAPFGKEDTAKGLQDHAAKTQDTLVDAVENAEVAEIKRAVFRALTRLRAATIKEFDTIARLETQAIDAYNDAHHYRAENPLAHLHEDEAPVETDKLKSFH